MTKLLQLNNFLSFLILFFVLVFNVTQVNGAEDIWKKKEDSKDEQKQEIKEEEEITIESPILSENINKIKIKIDEEKIDDFNQSLVGIFDPEENNLNLHMWSQSDGQEIKNTQPQQNANKVTKEGFCSSITSSS